MYIYLYTYMTFGRGHNLLYAKYLIDTEPITRFESVKDLDVVFDRHLNFHEHI